MRFNSLPQYRRTYRLSQNVKPLIWVECVVDKHSRSRTEYLVKARSQFKERSAATNVEISLPLPPDAISPTVRTSQVRSSLHVLRHCAACVVVAFVGIDTEAGLGSAGVSCALYACCWHIAGCSAASPML